MHKAPEKSVGIWVRVSHEDQARGESPEHHERRGRFYAESKGWQVKEVYHLEAVSGKSVIGLPEAKRMLDDIKAGRITGLIFSKLARLARNTRELLDFADIFREHNADLISLQESIDTSSPAGRLFYTMIAAMAQWEREEIAERVAASVPIRAKLGKPLGGQAPFGYRWENRALIPDPDEAPIRRRMYELFLEHRRKKTVARLLNDAGHRTRNGSNFSDTTVDRLIRDPTAKGLRRANYTKSLGDNKQWTLKPESDWVLTEVEPIISEELWAQCNALLDERKSGRRPGKKAVHLFAGVAYCACGRKMYVPSNSPKYICHGCRNKIGTTDLEAVFQEQLRNLFLSPTEIASYLELADHTMQEKQDLLQSLSGERKRVSQDMEKVMRLYLEDRISADGFAVQYRPLEERLKQIDNELPAIQGELDFMRIQILSSDQILAEAKDLHSRWGDLEREEKRKVVENITEKIVVGRDEIAIDLCYLPAASELVTQKQHNLTPALPFCHFHLKASRPLKASYPKQLKTLGDHIRRRRLDLDLFQRDVAAQLDVTVSTLWNWENNTSSVHFRYWGAIVDFLGYDPFTAPADLPGRLTQRRKRLGLSQNDLAEKLAVDESTIAHWEQGLNEPTGLYRDLVNAFLAPESCAHPIPKTDAPERQFSPQVLISARKQAALSRAALARMLGVNVHTLWRWERGDRQPHGLYRTLISRFLASSQSN